MTCRVGYTKPPTEGQTVQTTQKNIIDNATRDGYCCATCYGIDLADSYGWDEDMVADMMHALAAANATNCAS